MFKKPFKIKSNNQIKSTERKNLKFVLRESFRSLTENDIDNILPKKEVIYCMKILTADNSKVLVYLVQKRAVVFEFNNVIYPSVYLLWKYNNLLLTFTTTLFVVNKIVCGADLMVPGVVADPNGYGSFLANHSVSINSTDNKCPVAVGVTAIPSHDLCMPQSKGKCVLVYHFYGDKLCNLEDLPTLPLPSLGPPEWLKFDLQKQSDFPVLGGQLKVLDISDNINEHGVQKLVKVEGNVTDPPNEDNIVVDTIKEMDDLLDYCFFTAIKYSKSLELPLLTSTFYKMEMMPACPPDKTLDIKKSSFKKVGLFLTHMAKEGVIEIKEKKKGIEMIESIKRDHPLFVNFYVEPANRPKKSFVENEECVPVPTVVESYVVTGAVLPIFQEFQLKKGDVLQPTEIRTYVTNYVKKHNCLNTENKRLVNVQDPALGCICKNATTILWEELMEKVMAAMQTCYKVASADNITFSKGTIPPIMMTIQSRSGNKKVTLVDNIELYGIRMSDFAKECQHGVAASTSVSRPQGKKSNQLLVQGNQILFIYNLLVEKYKIPKKYIKGLEFAPKTKK